MKIQIIGGKVCLRYKGRTFLGIVSKLLKGEGDGMKCRLPSKIFSTLTQGHRAKKSHDLFNKSLQITNSIF